VYGPGECLGELSVLDGRPRSATAVAMNRVEALVVPRDAFLAILQENPRLTHSVLDRLSRRVRSLREQIHDTVKLDLKGRLARQLLDLADRYGEWTRDGVRVAVGLSQRELGQMIGGARANVNQALNGFQARGILTVEREGIVIHRPDELRMQFQPANRCRKGVT
jgi:CRP/FNR family transcriptional regulator